jgi:hypothetical protein
MLHVGPSLFVSGFILLCAYYGKQWLQSFQMKYQENVLFLKNHSYFHDQCENSLFRQNVPEYSSLCIEIVEFKHIGVLTKTFLEMTHIRYIKELYLVFLHSPRYIWIIIMSLCFLLMYCHTRWMRSRKIHIPYFYDPI